MSKVDSVEIVSLKDWTDDYAYVLFTPDQDNGDIIHGVFLYFTMVSDYATRILNSGKEVDITEIGENEWRFFIGTSLYSGMYYYVKRVPFRREEFDENTGV